MSKFLNCVLAGAVSLMPLIGFAADAPPGKPAEPTMSTEQALAHYREAMQAQRTDVMAKGLTLTADQAAKFWPLFQAFQKEQSFIIDAQIEAIKKYSDRAATLTDADAVTYVKSLLDRDDKMQALRVKWLAKFQSAVPGGIAARAIQLDRRISQLAQAQLSAQIPLVH